MEKIIGIVIVMMENWDLQNILKIQLKKYFENLADTHFFPTTPLFIVLPNWLRRNHYMKGKAISQAK